MANYRDPDFWQRRLSANSQPLGMGDQKLMMSTVLTMLADLSNQVETLNEEIQSLRSKRAPRSSKVVEADSGTSGDS